MSASFRRAKAKPSSTNNNNSPTTGSDVSSSSQGTATVPVGFQLPQGVKPWAGGIHLTSTGLQELDVILGGGQPLGTCICVQQDRWSTDLANSFVKYWCAEAISHEQCLVMPTMDDSKGILEQSMDGLHLEENLDLKPSPTFASTTEAKNLLQNVPRNLHWDKFEKKKADQAGSTDPTPQSLDILQEGDEDEAEDNQSEKEEGLDIAWQYRTSVQKERLETVSKKSNSSSTSSNLFCHSYDLSGRMAEQNLPLSSTSDFSTIVDEAVVRLPAALTVSQAQSSTVALGLFRELASLISTRLSASPTKRVIRLVLYHCSASILAKVLPFLLAHVRDKQLPVVVLVCSTASDAFEFPSAWIKVQRTSDVVMATEGFASRYEYPPPLEFRHLQGLLKFSKVSTVTAATANTGGHFADLTTTKRPTAFMYGLKRDRRKLHIPLLHIPPEDYAGSGSGSTSGVRSGAGLLGKETGNNKSQMGCASNTSGSLLDF